MTQWRLIIIQGLTDCEEWPLNELDVNYLGRTKTNGHTPDIDLKPDRWVSSGQARIWRDQGHWWIEDGNSKNGTYIDGEDIRSKGACLLRDGTSFRVGKTVVFLASPRWHRLYRNKLIIDLEVAPTINYSLSHCGQSVVPRLFVRNIGNTELASSNMDISIPGYARAERVVIPEIPPDSSIELIGPRFNLDNRKLETISEQQRSLLQIQFNEHPPQQETIECWISANNEWCFEAQNRKTLASFVMPNHPAIVQLSHDATKQVENDAGTSILCNRIYNHLQRNWSLDYRFEPPHWDSFSQRLRFPHQILLHSVQKSGVGTCIDLALLIAGCLEHQSLQPLISILEMDDCWHALVGCWQETTIRRQSLIYKLDCLREKIIWFDPVGCTNGPQEKLNYQQSCEAADRMLSQHPLVFSLDIAAARLEDITPLPFAGEPDFDTSTGQALEYADNLARDLDSQSVGSIHLLYGLLSLQTSEAVRVFQRLGVNRNKALAIFKAGLNTQDKHGKGTPKPTRNYEHILAGARALAKWSGSPIVLENHLFQSLLEAPNFALDNALEFLKIHRSDLLATTQRLLVPIDSRGEVTTFPERLPSIVESKHDD